MTTSAIQHIENSLYVIRGVKVMLDADLAKLYCVEVWNLTRAVSRNKTRFPDDFVFSLSRQELADLKRQIGVSSWGGRRSAVKAFTQEGVAMLSSVLKSKQAAEVNVHIMRAFVRLRELMLTHHDLARKLAEVERTTTRHDKEIKQVFAAIRQLIETPVPKKKRIGF